MISFKLKSESREQLTAINALFERDLPPPDSLNEDACKRREYCLSVIGRLNIILQKEDFSKQEVKVFQSYFNLGTPIRSLLDAAFEEDLGLGPSPSILVFSPSPPLCKSPSPTPRLPPSPLRQSSTTPPRSKPYD